MARQILPADLGLPTGRTECRFAQGRVCRHTGLAFAVKSDTQFNENGSLSSLTMDMWVRTPDNQAFPRSLLRIAANDKGSLQTLEVCGYPVSFDDPAACEPVLQFVRDIHSSFKDSDLPEVAKAFERNDLNGVTGKRIRILGQRPEGGLDLKYAALFKAHAGQGDSPLVLPEDDVLLHALFGHGLNTLRPDETFHASEHREIMALHGPSGNLYKNQWKTRIKGDGDLQIRAKIKDTNLNAPYYFPNLVKVFAKSAENRKNARRVLHELKLANREFAHAAQDEQIRVIGAINEMMRRAAKNDAPQPLPALVRYGLDRIVSPAELMTRQNLKPWEKQFQMISLMGNETKKLFGDIGDGLGACKLLVFGDTVIMHDFGLEMKRNGSSYDGAIVHLGDWKDKLSAMCITHRHADHLGGVSVEDFSGIPAHMTPQCQMVLEKEYTGPHKARMPDINPVRKNGYVTYPSEDADEGITVIYSPNATPHSASCTPFYYAAFYRDENGDKKIRGVYANFGDLRGESEENEGGKTKRFNPWFFQRGWKHYLRKAHPDLAKEDVPKKPTYVDWDSTSVRYKGDTPRFEEIRKNLSEVYGWFEGHAIFCEHLASSDVQFEAMLSGAAEQFKDVSVFGKNMEDMQSVQNIYGYERGKEIWEKGHQNQILMDNVTSALFAERIERDDPDNLYTPESFDPLSGYEDKVDVENFWEGHHATVHARIKRFPDDDMQEILTLYYKWARAERKGKGEDGEARYHRALAAYRHAQLKEPQAADIRKLYAMEAGHACLSDYGDNNSRYLKREKIAADLNLNHVCDLGGIIITRATDTSRMMYKSHPERTFSIQTGVHGNDTDAEAQTQKRVEGRDFLSGLDPNLRHTARNVGETPVVTIITQPAIPAEGNDKARKKLMKGLADKGDIVVNSIHDGFEIYNTQLLPPEVLDKIKEDLHIRGVRYYEEGPQNKLVVPSGFPVGYRGHGREGDLIHFMQIAGGEINASQHVNDPEAALKVQQIARSLKLGTIDLVGDGTVIALDHRAEDKAQIVGAVPTGMVLLRNDSPYQKPWRIATKKEVITVVPTEGVPTALQPLVAGCADTKIIRRKFGQAADTENDPRTRRRGEGTPATSPAPSDVMDLRDVDYMPRPPTRGPILPGSERMRLVV